MGQACTEQEEADSWCPFDPGESTPIAIVRYVADAWALEAKPPLDTRSPALHHWLAPSPAAHRGFLGNRHFALANEYLRNHDKAEIDWAVDGPLPAGPAKRAAADAAEAGAAAAADAAAEVTPEARPEAASETPGAASPASPE